MSGVACLIKRAPLPTRVLLDAMLARLKPRGPDGSNAVDAPANGWNCSVGHAAHWVTPEDVDTSQPLQNPSGNVISFDGRLDNRAELCGLLSLSSSAPDAALVLAAHEKWGEECPRHLLGDFAFVVWQPSTCTLFGARDRLGLISLYYHTDVSSLRLASEQQAFFVGDIVARANLETLASALVEEYCERGPTLYEGVFALEPGHTISWRAGKLTTKAYWSLDLTRDTHRHKSEQDCAAEMRETLREAVRARMRTRGRVAVAVSGGLDSSSVAALAVSLAREGLVEMPVLTTTRYPGFGCDEAPFSARLAEHLQCTLRAVNAPEASYLPPEPMELYYDAAFQKWRAMLDACSEDGVRVLMTGLGSDEITWRTGFEVDDAVMERNVGLALRYAGVIDDPLSLQSWRKLLGAGRRTLRGWRGLTRSPHRPKAFGWTSPLAKQHIESQREARARTAGSPPNVRPGRDMVVKELTFGLQCPFGISQYVHFGPHLGVESRHPFYDSRFVELVFAIPFGFRYASDMPKPLLRKAIEPLLPPSLTWRTQGAEFTSFFQAAALSLGETLTGVFKESRLEAIGLVPPGAMMDLFRAAETDPTRTRELVATFTYESWLRRLDAMPQPMPESVQRPSMAEPEKRY